MGLCGRALQDGNPAVGDDHLPGDECRRLRSEEHGDASYQMEKTQQFCECLGLSVNFKNCTRILSLASGRLVDDRHQQVE